MQSDAPPRQGSPLLPRAGAAAVLLAACIIAFAILAVWLHGSSAPAGPDAAVAEWLWRHTGDLQHPGIVASLLLAFSEPTLTSAAAAVVGLLALIWRRWNVAALAIAGPLLGLVLESYVLKPIIERRLGSNAGYAFPSGHETGAVSVLAVLVILLLRSGVSRRPKAIGVVAAVAWALLAALGLVRNGYHYFTDTWGGALLGVAVVVAAALVIDAVTARLSSPAGPDPSRTAPAA